MECGFGINAEVGSWSASCIAGVQYDTIRRRGKSDAG